MTSSEIRAVVLFGFLLSFAVLNFAVAEDPTLEAEVRAMTGPHPCKHAGQDIKADEELAIIPILVAPRTTGKTRRVPVPCHTGINVTSIKTRKSVMAEIIRFCSDCENKTIFLSPPAYDRLGEGEHNSSSITVLWDIENLPWRRTEEEEIKEDELDLLLAATNKSVEVLDAEIKAGFINSVQKNSLRMNEQCDFVKEITRERRRMKDYSTLFQNYTESVRLEMWALLDQENRLPGNFCNMYQGLACGHRFGCKCRAVHDPLDKLEPRDCVRDVETKDLSCILEPRSATFRKYGVELPKTTNECWIHNLCRLTWFGMACKPQFDEKKPYLIMNPDGNLMRMLRFPLRGTSDWQSLADCVCVSSRMLLVVGALTHAVFARLAGFAAANRLDFGSPCSTRSEQLKMRNILRLRALDSRLDPTLFDEVFDNLNAEQDKRDQFARSMKTLLESNGTFCKTYQRLMCNSAGVCDCYSNEEENVHFVREGDKCVLQRGSICDPVFWSGRFENYINPYEDDAERPACEQGLRCIDMETGKLCPRNATGVSFKDKIFPFLSPELKDKEIIIAGPTIYCKCGEPFESLDPAATRKVLMKVLVPLAIFLLLIVAIGIWNHRRLRASRNNFLLKLTELERRVFLEGDPDVCEDQPTEDEGIRAQFMPYCAEEYEIPKKYIKYGEQKGDGGFGIVRKAVLTRQGHQRQVAAKSCKDVNDLDSIRSILVELKIFQYIGQHDNVVQLIGAVTVNVPAPELILEYCDRGSLDQILVVNRTLFLNQVVGDEIDLNFCGVGGSYDKVWILSTSRLLRWSMQIANGMEYLSEVKHVIHGDLFLKNILVDANGVAKITDFGLSRRFAYDGKAYLRILEGIFPLPHLLPPEARQEPRKLSPQMDVWTFGVLLWEMFTLAMEPDCKESATELDKPEYTTSALTTLMRSCWTPEPADRIRFGELKHAFGIMLGDGVELNATFDFAVKFMSR